MICDHCRPWASTSKKQLKIRLRNLDYNQDASVFACPRCGGGEWATTDKFIVEKPSLLRRIIKYLKTY
jgi:hypothetical protein